jgi:hypothetical protein
MNIKLKVTAEFSIAEGSLEDALAEYDELTVEGLLAEIVDKSIACDDITVKVLEGPNDLESVDQMKAASANA